MHSETWERAADLETLLPRLMRILHRSIEDSILAELPLAQTRIIRLLYTAPRTITSIGEELGLTPSAVTQMANRLQEAGLIDRIEDTEDRRVRHLELTAKAQQLMRARQERRINRLKETLERLPEETQVMIHESLITLVNAAGQMPIGEPLSLVAELEQSMPPVPPLKR